MNNPIYDPPKLNSMFNKPSERIDAKLKIARTTPVIEIQFLIEEGNFILQIFCMISQSLTAASLQKLPYESICSAYL